MEIDPTAKMTAVKLAMAAAQVWTILFAVAVIATLTAPWPFLGPDERLVHLLPGVALLVIGWVWLLRIRRGIEKH